MGFFKKIAEGIKKTKDSIAKKLFYAFSARELDDEFYESLEEALLAGDVGVTAADSIVGDLKDRVFEEKIKAPEDAKSVLKEILVDNIDYEVEEYSYPLVILLSGVNGVGKTTAIGKLAHLFREQGKSVVIAAADTFRAAAGEQLEVWVSAPGCVSSATTGAQTPRQWSTTPFPPPRRAAPTSYSWTPRAGCTTRKT